MADEAPTNFRATAVGDPKSDALRETIVHLTFAIAEYGRVLVGELGPEGRGLRRQLPPPPRPAARRDPPAPPRRGARRARGRSRRAAPGRRPGRADGLTRSRGRAQRGPGFTAWSKSGWVGILLPPRSDDPIHSGESECGLARLLHPVSDPSYIGVRGVCFASQSRSSGSRRIRQP